VSNFFDQKNIDLSFFNKRKRQLSQYENYDAFDMNMHMLKENLPIVYISIIGLSGTGKTNLAYSIYDSYFSDFELLHYETYFNEQGDLILNDIINEIKQKRKVYVIFDDLSFIIRVYQKEIAKFLSELMKIRHYIQQGVLVFIAHYRKSILPVLREAHIIALTSLFRNQFEDMSKIFTWDSMIRFEQHARNFEHYALIWINGDIQIAPIGLSKTYIKKFGVWKNG
jgi:ABC-type dipeptide/oligopeptide/nickel transport system ATPase component